MSRYVFSHCGRSQNIIIKIDNEIKIVQYKNYMIQRYEISELAPSLRIN